MALLVPLIFGSDPGMCSKSLWGEGEGAVRYVTGGGEGGLGEKGKEKLLLTLQVVATLMLLRPG